MENVFSSASLAPVLSIAEGSFAVCSSHSEPRSGISARNFDLPFASFAPFAVQSKLIGNKIPSGSFNAISQAMSDPNNYRITTSAIYSHKFAKSPGSKGHSFKNNHIATRDLKPMARRHFPKDDPSFVVYAIHTDHLGTPIAMTNDDGEIVWSMRQSPFGEIPNVNDDPDEDDIHLTLNLRFPGQYYDEESGLNYNWHRYYDPQSGRYLQHDLVKLTMSNNLINYDFIPFPNTYSYTYNNPLLYYDPLGLWRNPWSVFDQATKEAEDFRKRGRNSTGATDAYRHCYASCVMTKENTSYAAQFIGWAYEKRGDLWGNQRCSDRIMDDYNNKMGRQYGKNAASDEDCSKRCEVAVGNGELSVIPPGDDTYWSH